MKRILLKFAHFILKRYGVIPLEMKDKVLFGGKVFEIQSWTLSQGRSWTLSQGHFETDLEIKMVER